MEKELCMRNFRFAFAAYLAVGVGNVFAQRFGTPSQLSYPSYRQQTPGLVRYMEPTPKPMPGDQAESAAPPGAGGMYSGPTADGRGCGMAGSCGCQGDCCGDCGTSLG